MASQSLGPPPVGTRVEVVNNGSLTTGTVRFVGSTQFASGVWVGVELDDVKGGKNDGSVQGVRYFDFESASPGSLAGVFMRSGMIKRVLKASPAQTPVANAKKPLSPGSAASASGSGASKLRAPSPAKAAKTPALNSTTSATTSAAKKKPLQSPSNANVAAASPPLARSLSAKPSPPPPPAVARTKTASATLKAGKPPARQSAASTPSDYSSSSYSQSNPLSATPPLNVAQSVRSSSSAESLDLLSGGYVSIQGDAFAAPPAAAASQDNLYLSVSNTPADSNSLAASTDSLPIAQPYPSAKLNFSKRESAEGSSTLDDKKSLLLMQEKIKLEERVALLTHEVDVLQSRLRVAEDASFSKAPSFDSSTENEELVTSLTFENEALRNRVKEVESLIKRQADELNAKHASETRALETRIQDLTVELEVHTQVEKPRYSASPLPENDLVIAALTTEVEELRVLLKKAEQAVPAMTSSNPDETLPKEVKDARARQMALMMKEVEDLTIRLKVTEEANSRIEDETSREYEAKLSVLNSENEDLKRQLKGTKQALAVATTTPSSPVPLSSPALSRAVVSSDPGEEIASLKDQLETLEGKFSRTKSKLKSVEDRLAVVEKEKLAAEHAKNVTLGKHDALAKEFETMKSRLKLAEAGLSIIDDKRVLEAQVAGLLEETEDLRFRLRAAEAKRSHDKDLTKEIDRLKQELGMGGVMNNTSSEKVSQLQAELKAALSDKAMLEGQLQEANDALEMVTLDCEYAQERADALDAELQNLKDQVEELNMDLDFVVSKRPEIELSPEQFEGVVTEINLLNNQNERLKDALVQFRDFSAMREKDLGGKVEELESELAKLLEQQENDSLIYLQLLEAETQIENLKESLDENAESAALVEYLTTKNLELGQRLDDMKDAVEDMQILQTLTDELEENHVLLEQELIEEIDVKDGMMEAMRTKINSQEEMVADYERTIHQFRDLVKTLQDDLSMSRMHSTGMGPDGSIHNTSRDLSSIDLLESAGVKAQHKGIDMELRKLDVCQAIEHLEIVKVYLPDTFFKSEHVPILSLLLMRRLVFKTNMIKMFLEDNFLSLKDPEQIAFVAELRHKLYWAMGLARRLVAFLEGCSEDVFVQFSSSYTELIGTERRIDVMVELLKIEEVIGQRGVQNEMQKVISHLIVLVDMFLRTNSSEVDLQRQSMFYIDMIDAIGDRFEAEMRRLESVFIVPDTIEDVGLRNRISQDRKDFLKTMPSIAQGSQSLRSMARKIHRLIDKIVDSNSTLSDELVALLGHIHKSSTMAIDYLAVLTGHVGTYVREQFELKENLSLALLNQLACNASDALLRMPEDQMGISLVTLLAKINGDIMDVLESLEDPMNIDPITETYSAPWLARATKIKSDYLLNNDLSNIIESLKADIHELVADLNEKKQLQNESQIRIHLLEKKTEDSRAEAAKISGLEARIKKLMENERAYMETVEGLTKEKTELEHDNEALKQNALRYEKMTSPPTNRRVGSNHPSPFKRAIGDSYGIPSMHQDGIVIDGDVAAQFEALKSALRFLRVENTKLKADMVAKTSTGMFKPVDPLMRRGLSNQKSSVNTSHTSKLSDVATSVVAGITRDSKNLMRDIQKVSATPAVVDIASRDSQPGKWVSMQKDPMFQHQRRVEAIDRLVQRGEDLQDTIKKVSSQIEESTGRGLLPKPTVAPVLLGRIAVPKMYADQNAKPYAPNDKCNIILTSRKQWENLHSMFAK
ncbi:dynein associated protein-domain-containing protein [Obelidium mucronatum]|nr:dynein associated protein-domain-containing protein [Obelidium mucronatum]